MPAQGLRKYDPLRAWLVKQRAQGAHSITLTFPELEAVLGARLPRSARTYRPWWGNETGPRPQAEARMDAGWEVDTVDLEAGQVTWRRS